MKVSYPKFGSKSMFKLLILNLMLHSVAWSQCGLTGDGTEESPWLINNYNELFQMGKGECTTTATSHYQLIDHVDASPSQVEDSAWVSLVFSGHFDGNGYTISSLYINKPSTSSIGFFGQLQAGASVRKLGLIDVNIEGRDNTAGLVGFNKGKISQCYVQGQVSGRNSIGGMIGLASADTVMNSYASVIIGRTSTYSGGLIGRANGGGVYSNNYANSMAKGYAVPGFMGDDEGTFSNNYYNSDLASQTSVSGVTGLTTEQFAEVSNFSGWNFDSLWITESGSFPTQDSIRLHPIFVINDPKMFLKNNGLDTIVLSDYLALPNDSYEFIGAQGNLNTVVTLVDSDIIVDASELDQDTMDVITVLAVLEEDTIKAHLNVNYIGVAGSGTEQDPILIGSWDDLLELQKIDALKEGIHYKLIANIDASPSRSINPNPSDSLVYEGWKPIPAFYGHLNGDGHVISNLFINRNSDDLGLVNRLRSGASIKNLGLVNIDYTGVEDVGAFAGNNNGTISNSYSTGKIRGVERLGGIAGTGYGDTLLNVFSSVDIKGDVQLGGLIGQAYDYISNSYYNGLIEGNGSAGGLFGSVQFDISISSSYWHSEMMLNRAIDQGEDGIELSTAEMMDSLKFEGWDFDEVWQMNPNGFPYLKIMDIQAVQRLKRPFLLTSIQSSLKIDLKDYFVAVNGASLSFSDINSIKGLPVSLENDTISLDGSLVTELTVDTLEVNVHTDSLTEKHTLVIQFNSLDGQGTEASPFLLKTLSDFSVMASLDKLLPGSRYLLENDIDASETMDSGWVALEGYSGHFNGGGHIISNLHIHDSSDVGLFRTTTGGSVQKVGLVNCNIFGQGNVGGIIGKALDTDISEVFVSGFISGTSLSAIGGVVGYFSSSNYENDFRGGIKNNYNTAHISYVNSTPRAGGVVGAVLGNVVLKNNYSTGVVSSLGSGDKGDIYGLYSVSPFSIVIGDSVLGNYWNSETSTAQVEGAGTSDLTITEMMDQSSFAGWDFDSVWAMQANGYPHLRHMNKNSIHSKLNFTTVKAGDSTRFVFSNHYIGSQGFGVSILNIEPPDSIEYSLVNDTLVLMPDTAEIGVLDSVDITLNSNGLTSTFRFTFMVRDLDGDGSEENPFLISSYEDLLRMKVLDSIVSGAHFELTQDIDASVTRTLDSIVIEVEDESEGVEYRGWRPHSIFNGHLDGKGFAIEGLYINRDTSSIGLFSTVSEGATISNLKLLDIEYESQSNSGGLAGRNNGVISNVHVTGVIDFSGNSGGLIGNNFGTITASSFEGIVNSNNSRVGGLVGYAGINSTIDSSYARGEVNGTSEVGGLAGYLQQSGGFTSGYSIISNSYFVGKVEGSSGKVGGLVGYADNGTISNSFSNAKVTSPYDYVGGLVGRNGRANISYSYAVGVVHGDEGVGGFVGINSGDITNSYACTEVVSTGANAGGFVGRHYGSGTVVGSYSCGSVTGSSSVGGFVGSAEDSLSQNISLARVIGAENSGFAGALNLLLDTNYFNKETSKQDSSNANATDNANLIGLTDMQFLEQASFSFLDFDSTWKIAEGEAYPVLQGVYNLPVAFSDSVSVVSSFSNTAYLFVNDYDYEEDARRYIAQLVSLEFVTKGTIESNVFTLNTDSTAVGEKDTLAYHLGKINAAGDTLWRYDYTPIVVTRLGDNTAPVAVADSLIVSEDSNVCEPLMNLVLNDSDADGTSLSVISVYGQTNGMVTYDSKELCYAPNKDFNGEEVLQYVVSDGELNDTAAIVVTVSPINDKPILNSVSLSDIPEDSSLTITNAMIDYTDIDGDSIGEIIVSVDSNAVVSGTTITPAANFYGQLAVHVSITDGQDTSNTLTTYMNVLSVKDLMQITAVDDITIPEDGSAVLDLSIVDYINVDNEPNVELIIKDGANFSVQGTTVIPSSNFNGNLDLVVALFDGVDTSASFIKEVVVTSINDAPVINQTSALEVVENTNFIITSDMIQYTDVENDPIAEILIGDGTNYSVNATTISPATDFVGDLVVPIAISDGVDTSAFYNATVVVLKDTAIQKNQVPVVHNIPVLKAYKDSSFTITIDMIMYSDVENDSIVSIVIRGGDNYTVNGSTITPNKGFVGASDISIAISDSGGVSDFYTTAIVFEEKLNYPPVITDVKLPNILEDDLLTITKNMIQFNDLDGDSIVDILIGEGSRYTVNGNVITPELEFHGQIYIPIAITDGKDTSLVFNASLTVLEENDPPVFVLPDTIKIPKTATVNQILDSIQVADLDTPLDSLRWVLSDVPAGLIKINLEKIILNQLPTFDKDTSFTIELSLIDGENVLTKPLVIWIEGRGEVAPIQVLSNGVVVDFINTIGIQISNIEAANRISLYSLQGELLHRIDISTDAFYQWSRPVLHGVYLIEMTGDDSRSVRSIQIRN